MKSLNLSVDCDLALTPFKSLLSNLPKKRQEELWKDAQPFLRAATSSAVVRLRQAITDPNFPQIHKSSPFIETSYLVQAAWGENDSLFGAKHQFKDDFQLTTSNREEEILHALNQNRTEVIESDLDFETPEEYLPGDEILADEAAKFFAAKEIPITIIRFKGNFGSRANTAFEGAVYVIYHSALAIKSTGNIRFPIFAGLCTANRVHETFSPKQATLFWKELVQQIQEKLAFDQNVELSEPSLTAPKPATIKSPVHLERLKYGKRPSTNQAENQFFDSTQLTETDVIGLNLDKKHQHALNAIQKMLYDTRFLGNAQGTELDGANSFKFRGYLPRIRFTRAEYLDAYGVKRFKTARDKWEFGGKESTEAMSALYDLAKQSYIIVGKRIYFENNVEKVDRYQTCSPIIKICEGWEGLSKKEDRDLDNNFESPGARKKHKGFLVEPCPLLVDQVSSHFVIKPANMYQEIKLKTANASKYTYTFIDWILNAATLKRRKSPKGTWPDTLEVSREALAYQLRLEAYIKARYWKRIDEIIQKCIQHAITLNWITKHEQVEGKTVEKLDRFVLNHRKFDAISSTRELESLKK